MRALRRLWDRLLRRAPAPQPPPPAAAALTMTPPQLPALPRAKRADAARVAAAPPDSAGRRELEDTRGRRTTPSGFRLSFSSGEEFEVRGTGIVGRNPARAGDYTHRVVLKDAAMLLSREHLEFGVTEAGLFWVRDLGSANGTQLERTGGVERELPPHVRTAVPHGAVVSFGEHSMTVSAG